MSARRRRLDGRRAAVRRAAAGAAIAATLLGPLTACGDGEPAVSEVATAELEPRTFEIRVLATAGRHDEALVRLEELRQLVAGLEDRDEITPDGAEEILERADALATELQQVTTTTTTAPPTTQPPRGDEGDGEDDEGGNGNGNGNGRDRERDERDD